MSAPATDLASRYGVPPPSRRWLLTAVATLLALAGLVWLAWVALFHSSPEVTSELVGYDVQGQHAVTATFTVVRSAPDVSASCLLRALAADHAVVGELTVPVDSGPTTARVTSSVRTERAATGVDLVGCTSQDQARPR